MESKLIQAQAVLVGRRWRIMHAGQIVEGVEVISGARQPRMVLEARANRAGYVITNLWAVPVFGN